ncbi:hypothetical protein HAHE_29540 [Haloferula helveola]|uniref:Uncharacterized protein n=2 Tax=Haloferula helveola TaxID=490095 RepID=A0ABN6H5X9_9BACT|nr:hypothetical protein HAHE_29540 [Haloferula helveola]
MSVLMVLLAVGLLSLSSISVRSSRSGQAMAEARANARLAMNLAIGQLQTQLGPDQRISAAADAMDEGAAQSHLAGAWQSWAWELGSGDGPDYSEKSDRFLGWLCSHGDPSALKDLNFAKSGLRRNAVTVLQQFGADDIQAPLVLTDEGRGGMAWATFDESLKAPIHLERENVKNTDDRLAERMAAPVARPDRLAPELEGLGGDSRLLSLETAALQIGQARGQEVTGRVHDLTTNGLGVLADAAHGGLRVDLSTSLESSSSPKTLFGATAPYGSGQSSGPTWDFLKDHYKSYESVSNAATGEPKAKPDRNDLRPSSSGNDATPTSERLMPIIAKMQIMFSVVTHHSHVPDRIDFYNRYGGPGGNQSYACPHLVYDPIVTLYNPYDVALNLDQLRIRVWDPPVGFRFKKNDAYLRPEFERGEFHSLARFQISNEKSATAEKSFTLMLTEMGRRNRPGEEITLQPGEVRVFSPWVEDNWTWGLEIGGGAYKPRSFFDWNLGENFANTDNRTGNRRGIEAVPGWDTRAGLQTDHLSYQGNDRPTKTLYDFELQRNYKPGWLAIRLNDTFTVEAAPQITKTDRRRKAEFRVDLLAGAREDVERDQLRSFEFQFGDVDSEISESGAGNVISRTFTAGSLLQTQTDPDPGGKTPFAVLTMGAKTTAQDGDNSKAWLFNNPNIEGSWQSSQEYGWAHQPYGMSFSEVRDFTSFPGVEIDPSSNRGYFGASNTADLGVSNVPMHRIPVQPATSLGDWINANLVAGSQMPHFTQPFGNSFAHPLIPANSVTTGRNPQLMDHSFLLNQSLWDSFYFSSVVPDGDQRNRSREKQLEALFTRNERLPNQRLTMAPSTEADAEQLAGKLAKLSDSELNQKLAANLMIDAPFNVNSASVDAWRAVLMSMRDRAVLAWSMREFESDDRTAFPRGTMPIASDGDSLDADASFDLRGAVRWAGYRSLDDQEIEKLATAIVEQIRVRTEADSAPLLSLGEFVNRRASTAGPQRLAGIIQTAIDVAGLNESSHREDSLQIVSSALPDSETRGTVNQDAFEGRTGEGAPSMLTQGDLLRPLAPFITVRGDTFKIRAYGDSRDKSGKVIATAWCEVIAQRLPEFVDSTDAPETELAKLDSEANQRFGRRFVVTGFRWLNPQEIQ